MDDPQQVASVSSSATAADEARGEAGDLRIGDGLEAFVQDLVKRQCHLLDAVAGLVVVRATRDQPNGTTAKFIADPRHAPTPQQYKRLAEIATQAVREDRAVAEVLAASSGLLSAAPEYRVLAAPLRLAGQAQGASVCVLQETSDLALQEGMTRLELSGILLEAFMWRQQAYAEAESKIQLREALDLLDKSNQGHTAREMASVFAHEMQRRFGCSRVSIGLVHGHDVRLVALSGTDDVDRKSELAEALEAVMEECADQDIEIRFPQPEDADASERRVVRAHASLNERYGPCAVASFPLRVDDGLIGVAVLEREPSDPFNDNTLRLLRLVAEYIGPAIWTRRLADRGILAVSRDRTIDFTHALLGPQKTAAKIVAIIALLVLLISVVVPVKDRVVADGRIIAQERRQVSVPFAGKIEQVFIQPGDEVKAGDNLIKLATREFELERDRLRNELAQLSVQVDEALANGSLSESAMLRARAESVEKDLELEEYRLENAWIKAPIDGTITQGRLDDLIGEVRTPETPLLEVAQLDTISAVVLVPENGISRVREEQSGYLALTARPGEKIKFNVHSITPASEVFMQRNVYRVEVELTDPPEWLRPGMEGQAKIRGRYTNLITIYSRPMIDALRMRFWW